MYRKALNIAFGAYWGLSPLLRPRCRFWPTCSHYAYEALLAHGPWRGTALAARRLMKCRPWGGHGFDPVPEGKA